ncbi:MAG: bifunctional hydroxymethylpyrimidine kinase/phosphomethylpyrimidine kinase [Duncaniella sp.]|nr:bifunctional hydroxymethylpyrimidine kinase/phosphomethylpyrimidine kinase [Duncaniella sp.]
MRRYFSVLTIAGSDPSGGAGIQADIKTISALGCYAMSVITSLTAQNTVGVRSIMPVTSQIVADQIDMIMEDIPPVAVKTGMLCDTEIAEAVASRLEHYRCPNLVVDPVMISSSGTPLLSDDAVTLVAERIFPLSALVTPNVNEALVLTGESEPDRQAKKLFELGCGNVLLKGGDRMDGNIKTDILYLDHGNKRIELRADAVNTKNTHGTGCTLSSAIASYLALGYDIAEAVNAAKLYITRALEAGAFVTTGHGCGPVNHFFAPRRLKNFNPDKKL